MAGIIGDIAAAEPAFTVERFEPDGERLEVAGHWRGLRGRRFVRPVLWLLPRRGPAAAGRRARPQAVGRRRGRPWVAAFPWSGGKLEAERAELEVGTELVVSCRCPARPRPKEPQTAKARQPTEVERLREQLAAETKERRALQESLDKTSREADTLARVRAERDAAREEAEHARADGERLVNDEYRQRERALAATEEALVRQREAEAARDLAERQLGAARDSHAELEAALAATEAARPISLAPDAPSRPTAPISRRAWAPRATSRAASKRPRPLRPPASGSPTSSSTCAPSSRRRNEDADRLRAQLAEAGSRPAPAAAKPAEVDRLERELAAAWADRDRRRDRARRRPRRARARRGRAGRRARRAQAPGARARCQRPLPSPRDGRSAARMRRRRTAGSLRRARAPRCGRSALVALGMVLLLLIAVALVLSRVL